MTSDMEMLMESLARAIGVPVERIAAEIAKRQAADRRRLARHAARWAGALAALTDVQAVLLAKSEQDGCTLNKFFIDRASGHVAPMLVKEKVWDGARHRMGRKLLVIYPDGSSTTTMEKSISVRRSF